jgi:hypothetical protein
VAEPIHWVAIYGTFGLTGVLAGIAPALLAARREPGLSTGSGFAVAFTSVGLGMVCLVAATLWRGFEITDATEAEWRRQLLEHEVAAADIDAFFVTLRSGDGEVVAVLAATLTAIGAGVAGALVARWRARRRARAKAKAGARVG